MQACSCAESLEDEASPAWIRRRESPHSVSLLGNSPDPRLRPLASLCLGRQTRRPAAADKALARSGCSAVCLQHPHEAVFLAAKGLPSRESEPYSHSLWGLLTLGTPLRDAAKFQAYTNVERFVPHTDGVISTTCRFASPSLADPPHPSTQTSIEAMSGRPRSGLFIYRLTGISTNRFTRMVFECLIFCPSISVCGCIRVFHYQYGPLRGRRPRPILDSVVLAGKRARGIDPRWIKLPEKD